MAQDQPGTQSILWVGKAPHNDGGDEILDRKLLAVLGRGYRVTRFDMSVQSRFNQLRGVLRGLPQPRYKFFSPALKQAFVHEAAQHDHVVISLEAFEHLARWIDGPVTLIIHNVRHDVLAQLYGNHLVGRIAAAQSLRWERRLYARENIHLVTLSRRDQTLVQSLAPGRPVAMACPGLPPLTALQVPPLQDYAVIREVVLSGSYDWHPKRRDLIALADEFAVGSVPIRWRHDLPLPDHARVAPIASMSRLIATTDFAQGIRFGLIPDRFLGGFKLKSTYFIANNCILLSCCDIRSEFAGLPRASQFVHYTPALADVAAVMDDLCKADPATLYEEWIEFRDACAQRFTWDRAAQGIARTWSGA